MTQEEWLVEGKKFAKQEISGREPFRNLLIEGCTLTKVSNREIAQKMEIVPTTVERWKNGVACPAPALQRMVIKMLIAKLEPKKE